MMLTFNLHFLTIWTTRIRWRLLHLDFLTNIVISPARRIISSIKPITFRIPIISRDCVACELGGFISRTRQIIFYYPIISRWYTLGICQFLQKQTTHQARSPKPFLDSWQMAKFNRIFISSFSAAQLSTVELLNLILPKSKFVKSEESNEIIF